jgi:hypothetical protein
VEERFWRLSPAGASVSTISARPVITLYRPMNFHLFSFKPAYVANILQVVRKNDSREGAHAVVFTEIQIMHAAKPLLYTNHAACNAADFADVGKGLRKWCASAKERRGKEECEESAKTKSHMPLIRGNAILGVHKRESAEKAGRRLLTRPKWNYEARGRLLGSGPERTQANALTAAASSSLTSKTV